MAGIMAASGAFVGSLDGFGLIARLMPTLSAYVATQHEHGVLRRLPEHLKIVLSSRRGEGL